MIFKRKVLHGFGSKTYKRTLIILLVTFESMLLIFAGALFGLFRHISTYEIETLNEEIVEKLSNNIQYMNELINKYSMLVFMDNVINPLLYNDGSGIEKENEIRILNHLHNMSDAYGIIHSVIIYNGVADRFYSWDSGYYEDEFVKRVKENRSSIKSPVMRELPRNIYYNNRNAMTYVIDEPYGTGGFIVINVSDEWINNNLSNADSKYSKLFIVDSDGTVIAQKRGKKTVTRIPETLMGSMKSDKGSVCYTDENGKSVTAIYHCIKDSDWKMVSVNYYNDIYSMIHRMQLGAILLTFAFACIGIVIVMLTGKSIYRPLQTLTSKIERMFGARKKGRDEIDYIYEIIEQSSEMSRPDCRVVLSEILLNGAEHRFKEFLELSGNLNGAEAIVLIYIKTVLNERVDEAFADIRHELITIHREGVIVIAADAADMDEIRYACEKLTGVGVVEVISYSKPVGADGKLGECYRNLENIAAYRIIYGDGRIITDETILPNLKNENTMIYPEDSAKKLTKLFVKGDMEEINSTFESFLNDISCNTINNYRIALMKLVMELFFDETVKSRDRIGMYSKRVLSAPNRETIQNIFSEMFEELIPSYKRFGDGQTAAKQMSKSDTIIETIKMLVNNQYYCTSLSVASMAEEMRRSSGYLGKLFKASEGMTVSDYIHMVRINNAVKILSGSNSRIKDVMEMVGYDNESTFYSKFKKYMGMTPKEFRTMNSDTSGMIY